MTLEIQSDNRNRSDQWFFAPFPATVLQSLGESEEGVNRMGRMGRIREHAAGFFPSFPSSPILFPTS
jgi:hypothetical protein